MMSIIRSMIKTLRKQKFRERDEKTNFSLLLLLLCLSFYVLRRSTTDNERRQTDKTFFLLLSFFRVHMRGLLPEEEVKKTNRRRCFSHEAVLTRYSQSSFELRSAFEFRFAQKWCPLFSLSRKIAAFPFVVVVECDEMREKEVYTRAS